MVTNHSHETSNESLRHGRKNNLGKFKNDNNKKFDNNLYATEEFTP